MSAQIAVTSDLQRLDQSEVDEICAKHERLCASKPGGARAVFAWKDLTGIDLRGRNLTEADFSGAVLVGCRFRGAKLDHANLFGCDFEGAFVGAIEVRFNADLEFSAGFEIRLLAIGDFDLCAVAGYSCAVDGDGLRMEKGEDGDLDEEH